MMFVVVNGSLCRQMLNPSLPIEMPCFLQNKVLKDCSGSISLKAGWMSTRIFGESCGCVLVVS